MQRKELQKTPQEHENGNFLFSPFSHLPTQGRCYRASQAFIAAPFEAILANVQMKSVSCTYTSIILLYYSLIPKVFITNAAAASQAKHDKCENTA
ncbi:hypothetical protein DV515_00004198, partial [Chloebia gouldiae]